MTNLQKVTMGECAQEQFNCLNSKNHLISDFLQDRQLCPDDGCMKKRAVIFNGHKKISGGMVSTRDIDNFKYAMNDKTFNRFSMFIQDELGIKMGSNKKIMLQARLMKRLRALELSSYEEYYDYLFSSSGQQQELSFFVHQVTTNKTDFFREPAHYRYLMEVALPNLTSGKRYSARTPMRIWSAACSTGEEPYTLAMVLSEYAELHEAITFYILATDISPQVLETASQGIYEESHIEQIPLHMQTKYLLRSKDKNKKLVRIAPELRSQVLFQWMNLKNQPFSFEKNMEIIFCRNVIIYFSRSTQEKVLRQLCNQLLPGGYIFMGHSETLAGLDLPINQVAPTIYRKK